MTIPKGTVAILGCGPAGLMAAHAVALRGRPIAIFSKPEKSKLGGAQYLHRPIPYITSEEPDTHIRYVMRGDAQTYRKKVYGDDPTVPFVSFNVFKDRQSDPAWSLIKAYDALWESFGHMVNAVDITPQFVQELHREYEMVLSTVPLPHICLARAGLINEVHHFGVQEIRVCTEDYADDVEQDTIVYDGTPERSWYRSSKILGVPGTEWSTFGVPAKLPVPTITDRKPIRTTCTCHPDVLRLGRRGTWTKGVLTHDAFYGALDFFG